MCEISLDAIKAWLLLLRKDHEIDIPKIVSYLEAANYGWVEDEDSPTKITYILRNPCIREQLCRRRKQIGVDDELSINDVERAEEALEAFHKIFFHKEYGEITLLIFSYCLAALFKSQLIPSVSPLYLQIACNKDSSLHELISDIVTICDVNVGFSDKCNNHWECNYEYHRTYFPVDVDVSIKKLSSYKDIPVIVDGYGNEQNYKMLLRTIINNSNRRKNQVLDSVLPIFLCSEIKVADNKLFSVDLHDTQISSDYLELIKKYERELMALVTDLVSDDFIFRMFPPKNEKDQDKKTLLGYYPFTQSIKAYIEDIHSKHKLSATYAKNAGALRFFFRGYMEAFRCIFNSKIFNQNQELNYLGMPLMKNKNQHITYLTYKAAKSLVATHTKYSPISIDSIVVVPEGLDLDIVNKARRYAFSIINSYKDFDTLIEIKKVEYKNERFVFEVKLLKRVRREKVYKEADNVSFELGFSFFRVVEEGQVLSIIASKKPITDKTFPEFLKVNQFNHEMEIPYAVGYDAFGEMQIYDAKKFPHLLLAGTTTSGKSTAIRSLLTCIAHEHRTGDVNVILIDLLSEDDSDFNLFEGYPFLSHEKVITSADEALKILLYLNKERKRRDKMKDKMDNMPYIICVIDEFPSLFTDLEEYKEYVDILTDTLNLMLRKARHRKIHFVFAAQNPTKKHFVCGNECVPTRMTFRVASPYNSVAVLGRGGANEIEGQGQMIFDTIGKRDARLMGSFITEKATKKLLSELREEFKQENQYRFEISQEDLDEIETELMEGG